MSISWQEDTKHSPGTLAARLAVDAEKVNGLTSTLLDVMIVNMFSFIVGLIIAFVASW
jgi:ATP-binding cassette subfamily B (MDR/TAP) protein 1